MAVNLPLSKIRQGRFLSLLLLLTGLGLPARNSDSTPLRPSLLKSPSDPKIVLEFNNPEATSFVAPVVWSPDGKWIAGGVGETNVLVWDAGTGQLRHRFQVRNRGYARIFGLEFSHDSRLLAVAALESVTVWDCRKGVLVRDFLRPANVSDVAWTSDDRLLAGWEHPEAVVLDVRKGRPLFHLADHPYHGTDGWANVRGFAWSPDGQLAANTMGGRAVIWSRKTGKRWAATEKDPGGGSRDPVAWKPRSRVVAISSDRKVLFWDLARRRKWMSRGRHGEIIMAMAWNPQGTRLATGSADGTTILWDTRGRRRAILRGRSDEVINVSWSPDGKMLATGEVYRGSNDGRINLWDATSGQRLAALPCKGDNDACDLIWSPDSRRLLSRFGDTGARMWDAKRARLLATFYALNQGKDWVTATPDGYAAMSANAAGSVHWSREGKAVPFALYQHERIRPDALARAVSGNLKRITR